MPAFTIQDAADLIDSGQPSEAITLLTGLIEAMPGHAVPHVLLAQAYEAEQRWDEALAAWQAARFWAPTSPIVRDGQARVVEALAKSDAEPFTLVEWAPDTEAEADADAPGTAATDVATAEESYTTSRLTGWLEQVDFAPTSKEEPSEVVEDEEDDEEPWGSLLPDDDDLAFDDKLGLDLDDDSPGDAADITTNAVDLDQLIQELEHARITPHPDISVPPPELDDDIEDMVSETLARIYAAQGQYDEAARVYELLAAQHPEQADAFAEKAAEMRARAGA